MRRRKGKLALRRETVRALRQAYGDQPGNHTRVFTGCHYCASDFASCADALCPFLAPSQSLERR